MKQCNYLPFSLEILTQDSEIVLIFEKLLKLLFLDIIFIIK